MGTINTDMNSANSYLQDIELPPVNSPDYMLTLIVLITGILLVVAGLYLYKQQQPRPRAIRRLRLLANTTPTPNELAEILRDGLQIQKLTDGQLHEGFLQRLNKARFSAEPCTPKAFKSLKKEALAYLEQNNK